MGGKDKLADIITGLYQHPHEITVEIICELWLHYLEKRGRLFNNVGQ